MEELNIGQRVQYYRTQKNISLRQLAKAAEISPSMLSQIENNSVNPSINTMKAIAENLHVPLYLFFKAEAESEDRLVVRKGEYRLIGQEGVEVSYKLLTPDVSGAIEFCRMDVPAKTDTTNVPREHVGEETAYVISGEIDIDVNGQIYHLREGDGIRIPPHSPHRWINNSDGMAQVIFAITPPSF